MAKSAHAAELRGLESTPGSSTRDGRFGRIFRTCPSLDLSLERGFGQLKELADLVATEAEDPAGREAEIVGGIPGKPAGDDEENAAIPAGYTYLGQFIDHDITFDPVSSLTKMNDPNALHNFRTPALDLDCVYGNGPDDEPFRFDRGRFILGGPLRGNPDDPGARDLPRAANGRAIIGDPRNDENAIVTQLQSVMMRFHNAVMRDTRDFTEARLSVTWHYQWMVIHDFLVRICGKAVVDDILRPDTYVSGVSGKSRAPVSAGVKRPHLMFYRPEQEAFMPLEFAGAAYRFGHSMVRPFYRLNATAGPFATFSSDPKTSLNGFRPLNPDWAIDWRLFFDSDHVFTPTAADPRRLQPSYKIDTLMVDPLVNLPAVQFGTTDPPSLALRNLLRGWRLGLPSGESVCAAMGITPLTSSAIQVGPDAVTAASVADGVFKGNTPLWIYVLAEAQRNMATTGQGAVRANSGSGTLGPVGARIVAETIIGLISQDRMSYLRIQPNWTPTYGRGSGAGKVFEMRDLIDKALKA